MAELHWNISDQATVTSAQPFFTAGNSVRVLQKNPYTFEEWKKLKDKCFCFEVLLADKQGQPKSVSGNIAWNNDQRYSKDPIQLYIGTVF